MGNGSRDSIEEAQYLNYSFFNFKNLNNMTNYVEDLRILNKLDIKKGNQAFTSVDELKAIVNRLIDVLNSSVREGVVYAVLREFPYTVVYNGYKTQVILNIYDN